MNGAEHESGARAEGFVRAPNPKSLYHSGNNLRCNNTICDGIVMWYVISGAKVLARTFQPACDRDHLAAQPFVPICQLVFMS
jgi:hypothetical protein